MTVERLTRCPGCGGGRWSAITDRGLDFTGQAIHHCDGCGLVFQSPRMDEAELQAYYAATFSTRFRGGEVPDARALEVRDRTAEYRFETLRRMGLLASGRSLLELGCGAGNFLGRCARAGLRVWGVEPSLGYAAHAQLAGLAVQAGMFPAHRGALDRYDLVALFHVLEHLPEPLETLRALRALLEPDGHLVIEVPDLGRSLGLRWSERYFHAPHLVDFSEDSLERLLRQSGFVVSARDTCDADRARRHHLLVVARPAPPRAPGGPPPRRWLLWRLLGWIAVTRLTRPAVLLLRRLDPRRRRG